MKRLVPLALVLALALTLSACGDEQTPASGGGASSPSAPSQVPAGWGGSDTWEWPSESGIDPSNFVAEVTNPYWPLPPGAEWHYAAETDDGTETIKVVVLAGSKEIMGVACTVVRDTVKLDGELIEDTYDWYAQDKDGNVWYMGEDSKEYEGGKVVSTSGSWQAGLDGAEPGIKVWAQPHVGGPPYFQEYYQGEAEDLGKDLGLDGTAQTPTGTYDGLLVVEEWTPLDPGFVERKYYKAGVGAVKEEMTRGGSEVVLLTGFRLP